jgi:hypothetical protein
MSRRLRAFVFVLRRGAEERTATWYSNSRRQAERMARTWAEERGWRVARGRR